MRNARETTETASAANHLEHLNRAAPTPLRSDTDGTANRFATYVARCWLPVLERITAPLLAVTKCDHNRSGSVATRN